MRGCQRKIIMLKGTDSQIFDEAYFLLRRDCEEGSAGEESILREAERIVARNATGSGRRALHTRRAWVTFLCGVLFGCGILAILLLIF